MNKYIKKIIEANKELFAGKNNIQKINVGFTNLLYLIDNKYIVKVCNKKDNEDNFNNEIKFYINNSKNIYIPQLYSYYISSSKDDYSYEIIEKINGKSLYSVWHTFDEEKRKDIIKEIVKLMKTFHSKKGEPYDWSNYIIDKLKNDFNKCYELKLFSGEEKIIAENILNTISPYLESNDFRLVHSDIHFDNILLCENGQLKIIDFETALYAPIDYELDIFMRMCNNPLKYASEEAELLVKIEDYKNIISYLKMFYPEIFRINNFDIRHLIYDLEANLRLLPKFSKDRELKEIIIGIMNKIKNKITFKE